MNKKQVLIRKPNEFKTTEPSLLNKNGSVLFQCAACASLPIPPINFTFIAYVEDTGFEPV